MSKMQKTLNTFQEGIDQGLHTGAQLCVWRGDACVIDTAIGTRDGISPMTSDSIALWLSCGKPISAVVIMRMYEDGLIDLDAPVAEYWAEFAHAGKSKIQIKHLLNHTCGIRQLPGLEVMSYEQAIQALELLPPEDEWVIGKTAGYHPVTSWLVLGKLMENLTGRSPHEVINHYVFHRLGMKDCSLGISVEQQPALKHRLNMMYASVSHRSKKEINMNDQTIIHGADFSLIPQEKYNGRERMAWQSKGSNLRGPTRELVRFYRALMNGGTCPETGTELVSRDTMNLMTSPARDIHAVDKTFLTTVRWGLGIMLYTPNQGKFPKPYSFGPHASERAFGHGGAQSGIAFSDPEHELVVAWTTNGQPREPIHQKRNHQINQAIYEDLGLDNR